MGGMKQGTGSLDFEDESDEGEEAEEHEIDRESTSATVNSKQDDQSETEVESTPIDEDSGGSSQAQMGALDMDDMPYLVKRQVRGASVNADRTKQLLLEVRPTVKEDEESFLSELQDLVDGPVYKGDAREAIMVVAQENPELVAEKLREWGVEFLDK